MSTRKEVLVVTATLGKRESLQKTVESVARIGGDRVKHVIVCPEYKIAYIKERYPEIECVAEDSGKRGIYAALNKVFNTYGKDFDYLTFINDDDYWLPNYELLIDSIVNKDLDLVYGKVEYVIEKRGGVKRNMACSSRFYDFIPLLYNNIVLFTQQSTIIKSSLYFEMGGFDETYKLVSDSKFWAELSLKKIRYQYIPKVCAAYTIQEGQLSSASDLQKRETIDMLSKLSKPTAVEIKLALLMFRISNLPIYIKRIVEKQKIKI